MLHQTYYGHLIGQDPIILKRFFTVKRFIGRKYCNMFIGFLIRLSIYCNLEHCVLLSLSNFMFVGLFGNDNPFGMPPVCAQ